MEFNSNEIVILKKALEARILLFTITGLKNEIPQIDIMLEKIDKYQKSLDFK